MNNLSNVDIHSKKAESVLEMINAFLEWGKKVQFKSFDWWDMWGISFGGWAKTLYVKNKLLGSLFVLPILILDFIYPDYRKFFVEKRSFPISYAHLGMSYLNLYTKLKDNEYLKKAENLVPELLKMASPQVKDLGWGMKLQWMTIEGLVPTDTPCNTQTSYVYEFFVQLYNLTKKEEYLDYLAKIARHVSNDFPDWCLEDDMLVSSYTTIDKRRVVNANSYRMYILIEAGKRFDNPEYLNKGISTMKYVLSRQNLDGSWPYSEDELFVDCYHTCFVLKNLYKVNKILGNSYSDLIDKAIDKGVSYYLAKMFDSNKYPIPFSVQQRITIFKYDSYDLAESIGLLADLNIEPELMFHLIDFAKVKFQTKEGWFRFRIYKLFSLKGIPYMRCGNSAMLLSLTKALNIS